MDLYTVNGTDGHAALLQDLVDCLRRKSSTTDISLKTHFSPGFTVNLNPETLIVLDPETRNVLDSMAGAIPQWRAPPPLLDITIGAR